MILSDFRVFSPPKLCLFRVVGVLHGLALFVVSWFLLASVTWCLQLLFCIFLFVLHMKMMSGLFFGFRWFLRVFGLSPNIYLRILGLNASVWLKSSMIFVSSENYANFILN